MADVDFWFEMASPYSYMSAVGIDSDAEVRGITIRWRPFLLGPVFKAQGLETSPFKIYPVKGRYMWRDVARRAERVAVPFKAPNAAFMANFPPHTVTAARLALVGLDDAWGKRFIRAAYKAEFYDHLDISDKAVLARLVEQVGGDPDAALRRTTSEEIKLRLRQNTEEAAALGIFGAPSFVVSNELFWGDDRLDDALDWAREAKN